MIIIIILRQSPLALIEEAGWADAPLYLKTERIIVGNLYPPYAPHQPAPPPPIETWIFFRNNPSHSTPKKVYLF